MQKWKTFTHLEMVDTSKKEELMHRYRCLHRRKHKFRRARAIDEPLERDSWWNYWDLIKDRRNGTSQRDRNRNTSSESLAGVTCHQPQAAYMLFKTLAIFLWYARFETTQWYNIVGYLHIIRLQVFWLRMARVLCIWHKHMDTHPCSSPNQLIHQESSFYVDGETRKTGQAPYCIRQWWAGEPACWQKSVCPPSNS